MGHIAVDSDVNIYFAQNLNTGAGAADHTIQKLTRSTPFTGTPSTVGGAADGGGDTGGGDTGGDDDGSDDDTTVTLPADEVGPIGLDLDTTASDQMVRQTPTNPSAGDEVEIDVFITAAHQSF